MNAVLENPREEHAIHGIGEVSLLLPRWQLCALEQMAEGDGLTVGQLLRRVVQQAVHQSAQCRAN